MHRRSNLVAILASKARSLSCSLLSIARIQGVSHRSSPNGAVGICGSPCLQMYKFYHTNVITGRSLRFRNVCAQAFWAYYAMTLSGMLRADSRRSWHRIGTGAFRIGPFEVSRWRSARKAALYGFPIAAGRAKTVASNLDLAGSVDISWKMGTPFEGKRSSGSVQKCGFLSFEQTSGSAPPPTRWIAQISDRECIRRVSTGNRHKRDQCASGPE
jgi:hypothetical protein